MGGEKREDRPSQIPDFMYNGSCWKRSNITPPRDEQRGSVLHEREK